MSNQIENPKVDVPMEEVAQHIDQRGDHVDMSQTMGAGAEASAHDGEASTTQPEGTSALAYSGSVEDAPKWTTPVKEDDVSGEDGEKDL